MSFVAERKVTHAVQALTDPATPQVVDEVPQRST
jgi:hypothetical protein